jgi:hypothetical protein
VKNKKQKNIADVKEVKLEVPSGLKILCIFSFIGFIYCLLLDTSDYLAYSNFHELATSADQSAYELMEERIANYEMNDIDTSDKGMDKLARMSIYRTIFDVIAMVGTALMFFRVKRGFYIYAVSQFLYVAIPFFMFGLSTFAIFDKGMVMIPIIYIGLFTTQIKHLTR